jgi:hypothetical protein
MKNIKPNLLAFMSLLTLWALPINHTFAQAENTPDPFTNAYQPLLNPVPIPIKRSIFEKRKADKEQVRIEMGLKRLPVWDMSYTIWRPELAARFKLPPSPEGAQLPADILAIEFYVNPSYVTGSYSCNIRVFADEQLPFAYPLDLPVGSDEVLAVNKFFTFNKPGADVPWNEGYLRMSEADRDHMNKMTTIFLRSTYLASADFVPNKSGFQTSHTLTEFNRKLLPGIAYLNIRLLSCNYLARGLKHPVATELWLERKSGKNYVQQLPVDKSDFIRVTLPRKLLEVTAPWIKQIEQYNDAFRKELKRRKLDY